MILLSLYKWRSTPCTLRKDEEVSGSSSCLESFHYLKTSPHTSFSLSMESSTVWWSKHSVESGLRHPLCCPYYALPLRTKNMSSMEILCLVSQLSYNLKEAFHAILFCTNWNIVTACPKHKEGLNNCGQSQFVWLGLFPCSLERTGSATYMCF